MLLAAPWRPSHRRALAAAVALQEFVQRSLAEHRVLVFSKSYCGFSMRGKAVMRKHLGEDGVKARPAVWRGLIACCGGPCRCAQAGRRPQAQHLRLHRPPLPPNPSHSTTLPCLRWLSSMSVRTAPPFRMCWQASR